MFRMILDSVDQMCNLNIAVFASGMWNVIEPVMTVEVTAPLEFQGSVLASLNKRHAIITGQDASEGYFSIFCEVRSWAG